MLLLYSRLVSFFLYKLFSSLTLAGWFSLSSYSEERSHHVNDHLPPNSALFSQRITDFHQTFIHFSNRKTSAPSGKVGNTFTPNWSPPGWLCPGWTSDWQQICQNYTHDTWVKQQWNNANWSSAASLRACSHFIFILTMDVIKRADTTFKYGVQFIPMKDAQKKPPRASSRLSFNLILFIQT